jgi:hypothetical protein
LCLFASDPVVENHTDSYDTPDDIGKYETRDPCTTPSVSHEKIAIRRSPPPIHVGISRVSSHFGFLHISTSIMIGNVI